MEFSIITRKDNDEAFNESEKEFWQKLIEGTVVEFDIFTACALGDIAFVKNYIFNSQDLPHTINKQNYEGWTPLMYVCYTGYENVLELLLRENVDILAREATRDRTPLILASSSGNCSVVKRLVQKGAEIDAKDKNGRTALFYAAEQGHLGVVKFLLSKKADVYICEYDTGYTPFMEAARQGNEYVFHEFLEYGIDLTYTCKKGLDCLDLARENDAMIIVNMIDNYCSKNNPSPLRNEPELAIADIGRDDAQLPVDKVRDWLNFYNPNFVQSNLPEDPFDRGENPIVAAERNPSFPRPIEYDIKRCPINDPYGMSAETLLDADRTPVGTPVDSMLQQYMSAETKPFGRHGNDALPTLESFLEDLRLEKYKSIFEKEFVDFRVLLSLTDEDFKELGLIKLGPRKKLKLAISKWKSDAGWCSSSCTENNEVTLKRQLADVHAKLQAAKAELANENAARLALEAEHMEERARRNHIYLIAEKIQQSCQELQHYTDDMTESVKHLGSYLSRKGDITQDCQCTQLETLHVQLSVGVDNTGTTVATIQRRLRKMFSDDLAGLSSESDSPESSCTSITRSESSVSCST